MSTQPVAILLDSSQLGGIETHVMHLARGLTEQQIPVQLWFYKRYSELHPLEEQLNQHNIPYRFLSGNFSSIRQAIRQIKPVVLHTHGYKAGVFGRLSAFLENTPVASTFHNGDKGAGIVRLYTWLDRLTSRMSSNICVSDEIARRLSTPSVCLNNFINVPKIHLEPGNNIAFVGRLSHEKGPDLFLQLAKHLPELPFRMYGSGPMEQNLIPQAPENVQFMGQVSGMEKQWHEVGLLCISSREEGLPMVALEAMAHGVPVAAFRLGALPQLIQQNHNGWIAPEGNIKILSQLIECWSKLPKEQLSFLSSNCKKSIAQSYSYDAVIPKVLAVYKDECSKKGHIWPEVEVSGTKTPASLADTRE